MLYVVGDSNSVYTSSYLIQRPMDNTSLCKVGWKTEDVLRAVQNKKDLSDATAFFVFVGMNDRLSGEGIASNILQIVSALRARRSSLDVKIFLAPPFCVDVSTPTSLCEDRKDAAQRLVRELGRDGMGSVLVTSHVTRNMQAKKTALTLKKGSNKVDPLHLNETAYMNVANVVNEVAVTYAWTGKRSSKPKKIYEAGPAPPPKVAWEMERQKRQRKD